jgi:hypothetical protein
MHLYSHLYILAQITREKKRKYRDAALLETKKMQCHYGTASMGVIIPF